ncbi:fumarylacetoacetate hydrolase family protein [Pararhizobium sp. BT-229]|uniref:fumarylacetoacetate hydrolase family protein n=1 Tax=Pararhizobium sp. BT-229 TaxID=2986923 RepID=UPI0021F6AD9E|nr:fumarylacetoacetate hydrolase family protein [Pararhizobium sp. BT-229]MCV9966301.1 fumarylacetoacetate hydrolase family protein [Pararhizobium sp. BT-229]
MPATATLARQLSDADNTGARLVSAMLAEPATVAEAFAVQRETLALNGWLTAGYKVAIRTDGSSVSAPMAHITYASESGTAGFERPAVDALEVEICFVLGKDLPPPGNEPYTRETLLDHVSAIYSGAEFLGHRLDDGSKSPALLFLADRLGNAGYVLGEELSEDVLEPGRNYPLTITVNGNTVFSGPGKHPNGDPVTAFLAFANTLTHTVAKGRIITTGSLCGALPLPEARAAIAISGFTTLTVTAASTRQN